MSQERAAVLTQVLDGMPQRYSRHYCTSGILHCAFHLCFPLTFLPRGREGLQLEGRGSCPTPNFGHQYRHSLSPTLHIVSPEAAVESSSTSQGSVQIPGSP